MAGNKLIMTAIQSNPNLLDDYQEYIKILQQSADAKDRAAEIF